jgi:hypothetical protein
VTRTAGERQRVQVRLDNAARTLNAVKLAAGCVDCGYRVHPQALHFDHRDPSTKRADLGWVEDRSKLTSAARLQRFLAHVDVYCDVRCGNCHAIRSATEQHWRGPRRALADQPPTLF